MSGFGIELEEKRPYDLGVDQQRRVFCINMDTDKQGVAAGLFAAGVIRFGAFRLKLHESVPDAPLSPFYIDLRLVRSFPDLMDRVTNLLIGLMRGLKFDLIADVPTAGTPFAAIIAHKLRMPMITPRLENKQHGSRARVDGAYTAGQTAIVLDDLVTHSESKLEAVQILVEQGLVVNDVVVLIDREQGGVQALKAAGLECHAAFRLSELLEIYRAQRLITSEQFEAISLYRATQTA
jgi:uridine monophosphate synthetase